MTFWKLTTDGYLLFGTRAVRMFAYGFLSVVLVRYLAQLGLSQGLIGLLLSLTLFGDAVISLWMTTTADRVGRRRILIAGAALMLFAGLLFALTDRLELLLIAAIIGVISPSGYEVGPFLPVEQAALSQIVPDEQRTQTLAWYNLAGSFATAAGALCGGGLTQLLQQVGVIPLNSYRTVVLVYGVIGVLLALLHPIIRLGRGGTFELSADAEPLRLASLSRCCAEAVYPIRFGRLCGRLRRSKYRRLLVSCSLWR